MGDDEDEDELGGGGNWPIALSMVESLAIVA